MLTTSSVNLKKHYNFICYLDVNFLSISVNPELLTLTAC